MCLIDETSSAEAWSDCQRRARKVHKCDECRRVIAVGESYRLCKWRQEGSWWQARQCSHCQVAADWLLQHCSGYVVEAVREDLADHWNGKPTWVGRVLVGMRRGWKQPNGALMPVPVLPAKKKSV